MESYEKYRGNMYNTKNDRIKKTMNLLKGETINKYEKNVNSIIDIGIGRGTDLKYYANTNVRRIVGIEPSKESFLTAINKFICNYALYDEYRDRFYKIIE